MSEGPDASFLPYGRQSVTEADRARVLEVLGADYLTQGPVLERFEAALAQRLGTKMAVAFSSGTAALHAAAFAVGVGPDRPVVTTPITFIASANCGRYLGADVRLVDVDPDTGLMRPDLAGAEIEDAGALIPVHLSGAVVDLPALRKVADQSGATLIQDACHAIGATFDGEPIARWGDLTALSFHPVKHITTAEGGAILTDDPVLAEQMREFRHHGIVRDPARLDQQAARDPDGTLRPWYHEMQSVGFNYRLSEIHAALGLSQLARLDENLVKRRALAARYDDLLADLEHVQPQRIDPRCAPSYHLYIALIDFERIGLSRAKVMNALRERGIGTQVHYIPLHHQPVMKDHLASQPDLPGAEAFYARDLSLPMFHAMALEDVDRVVGELKTILRS